MLSKTRNPTAPNRQGNLIDRAHEVTSGHPAILIIVPFHRGHHQLLASQALSSIALSATRLAPSTIADLGIIVAVSLVPSPPRTEQFIVLPHAKLYHRRDLSVPNGPRLRVQSSGPQSRSLHPRNQRRATHHLRSPLPHRRCQRQFILGLHGQKICLPILMRSRYILHWSHRPSEGTSDQAKKSPLRAVVTLRHGRASHSSIHAISSSGRTRLTPRRSSPPARSHHSIITCWASTLAVPTSTCQFQGRAKYTRPLPSYQV